MKSSVIVGRNNNYHALTFSVNELNNKQYNKNGLENNDIE